MNEIGSARYEAFSAGVTPKGQVSPITLRVLQERFRIDASGARSKSWEEFKDEHLDFVVSVSEQAEETSHAFPGKPILAHWPYDDPTKVQGTPDRWRRPTFASPHEFVTACSCSITCRSIRLINFAVN